MSALPVENLDTATSPTQRHAIWGDTPNVLTEVYDPQTNMVIWQRPGTQQALAEEVNAFMASQTHFKTALTVEPDTAFADVHKALGQTEDTRKIGEDVAELVDMFCCLFDLKQAGLRLAVLDSAMCPRFHVDRVPCRLVTTYQGVATQWLPHNKINRDSLKLRGSKDVSDQAGLYQSKQDIEQLQVGDVALLKGELWEGNENAGLVHRSPCVPNNEKRLLLTLDFIN